MVDTRPTGNSGNLPIRSDGGGRRPAPGRSVVETEGRQGGRGRIPTLRQLASLVVNGVLTLPPNYRRGMYLDLLV